MRTASRTARATDGSAACVGSTHHPPPNKQPDPCRPCDTQDTNKLAWPDRMLGMEAGSPYSAFDTRSNSDNPL